MNSYSTLFPNQELDAAIQKGLPGFFFPYHDFYNFIAEPSDRILHSPLRKFFNLSISHLYEISLINKQSLPGQDLERLKGKNMVKSQPFLFLSLSLWWWYSSQNTIKLKCHVSSPTYGKRTGMLLTLRDSPSTLEFLAVSWKFFFRLPLSRFQSQWHTDQDLRVLVQPLSTNCHCPQIFL